MAIKTFKRVELKYMVNQEQYEIIRKALAHHMILDKHCLETGRYMIYNLYFDGEDDGIIRRSIEKPYYKEKLRLRSYQLPLCDDDLVFLELKKKIGGVVAKRRATLTYREAMEFIDSGIFPESDNYLDKQVLLEIVDFLQRNPSKPKVFISYERTAFFGKDNPSFRISFDSSILTRRNKVSFLEGDFGTELMDSGLYLMEVKLCGGIPLWLCQLLSDLKIFKISFSKYGTEYRQYMMSKREPARCPSNASEDPVKTAADLTGLNITA